MIVHERMSMILRRAGASVKNIPDDVQLVNRQPLNQRAQRHDEAVRLPKVNADGRVDDLRYNTPPCPTLALLLRAAAPR